MPDLPPSVAPAGWYADHAAGVQRWWDGRAWTSHTAPLSPPVPSVAPPASGGVTTGAAETKWIWPLTLLLAVGLVIGVLLLVWTGDVVLSLVAETSRMSADPQALADGSALLSTWAMIPLLTIASFVVIVLSWVAYGVGIWLAYLDYRDLGRIGHVRRFHWAWNFLSPVYPIGRSVVAHRERGNSRAPMWVAISLTAASILLTLGWCVWLMARTFDVLSSSMIDMVA